MTQYLDGTASAWFSHDDDALEQGDPITLVTVQLDTAVDDDALQFLERAERKALTDWAKRGRVLMALVSHNRRELNLIVACNDDNSRMKAEEIPSVASEMAQLSVRAVTPLTLNGQRKFVTH
jgi:hypothetical protein